MGTVSWPGNRIENDTVSKGLHGTYPTLRSRSQAFALRHCESISKTEKVKISMHLCLLWRYASRFIQSKIPESCKSEVKPQIKVVIVQQSAALRARLTIFTSRDSQFRARPFSNRCGFAVYTTSKPYRFENAPLLKAYSKRPGFDNELGRLRVNERCNRIETDAVTNETASV